MHGRTDLGAAYADARKRAAALFASLDEASLATPVPARPALSVRDVLARHIGFVGDFLRNDWRALDAETNCWHDRHAAMIRDARSAEQVAERADRSIGQLLHEWDRHAAGLEPILSGDASWETNAPPFAEMNAVVDLAVSIQDVRGALDRPGDRDTSAARLGLIFHVGWFGLRVLETGAPAISIGAGASEWTLGVGAAAASVSGHEFEMFRALSGRRSEAEIRSLAWTGDPSPYLAVFAPYPLPAAPVGA